MNNKINQPIMNSTSDIAAINSQRTSKELRDEESALKVK